ncbi:MAG: hypothetical protein MI861_24685 [Pirellulales bacterium]|nr:hypothetical protein [Pirellulales bacterium]
MMEYLREIARQQLQSLDALLSDSVSQEEVRGVTLNVDPYWYEYFKFVMRSNWWLREEGVDNSIRRLLKFQHDQDWDQTYRIRPPDWEQYCRRKRFPESADPITIKVAIKTEKALRRREEWPIQFEGHPIEYEYRPPSFAFAARVSPSSSIGQSTPWKTALTAGGFLKDTSSGDNFLVSCAHGLPGLNSEVRMPSPIDANTCTRIGDVSRRVIPNPNLANTSCNSYANPTDCGSLDMAMVTLDSNVSVDPQIKGVGAVNDISSIANMMQYDHVVFRGKRSGKRSAQLGGLCLWYEINAEVQLNDGTITAEPHCFRDIFEITHTRPFYLNTDLAKKGDSGSWVVAIDGQVVSWDGLLIAGDGCRAYACFAELVFDECRSMFPNIALF